MMKKDQAKVLTEKHQTLVHSDNQHVISHVQRENNEWYLNTLMLEGVSVPFKYKRKKQYRSLKGQRVNLTYYSAEENIAGFEIEVMNVVRIKVS